MFVLQMCSALLVFLPPSSRADLTCDAALVTGANASLQSPPSSWNETQTQTNASVQRSGAADAYCEAALDGIGTCWPRSPAARVVARPCPETFYGVRYNTTNSVYRTCLANGTWAAKGNYSMCTAILHQEKKGKMHYQMAVIINFLGHAVSMLALLVAFFLFLCLRSIRCLRNIIHWNLIGAFILRNATWFVVQLTMSPQVHESNVVWCRLVTASFNYFHSTNFFWMFGEGCYLHTAIVLTYSTDKLRKWMFICIGWCIPLPIIVAWAVGKLYYDNEKSVALSPTRARSHLAIFPVLVREASGHLHGLHLPGSHDSGSGDQLHLPLQHRQDPDDQTAGVHHLRDHPVQESGEGHLGAPPPSGHHLHAVLRQPRRGRDLAAGLHLLQLLPGILPGVLRFRLLLLPEQ
ncbi:corticotropin-releasing factor receptor 1-like isoform X12 [Syngnathoides biaculeatus]|uniref:corticotropin-releasing factor receptor 1-like isoform X12 n=1 Tax=Syngnathoides biaculeatus TaxID=300417 RepID=UPI002ADDB211|nr:corticotropin-releasing factor receptor 1-like isoform X12 [Syngnathoides biaculeatus]XP_061667258.1 corticotropin-releasing factor receptor 1-like isoform X12 [Syngnathoides biaculeatus]XP_061667259.1 corticotropin-releasing factor receptor 1-like isoform X12 [Syngnathoides biaculeatus]XP_061667260.1 corticotropin-releasing factor receptor 1-like isoform X12 [Syngnathoides biaculeatus]XP_061667261.1 corticotropin-releasing factor receptor 1-like isoform X12 [Syngnathoides biaculeatus]XP_06